MAPFKFNSSVDGDAEASEGNRVVGTFGEIGPPQYSLQDRQKLASLGKKEALKRRFGSFSLFGFSCAILITWERAIALFPQALKNGGPGAVAWGFLIAWMCSLSVYMCLAEMASIAPIAGGQYFWVSILAPKRYKRFLSYLTGWLTCLAWVALLATDSLYIGTQIQALIILGYPEYIPQSWQGYLFCVLVVAVCIFVNILIVDLLPFLEGVILLLHVMGFVGILVTIVYLSPHVPASDVFFKPLNGGNWPTQGLSYCVGYIGSVVTFGGADAAVHMSEEIENAAVNVPKAIFSTVVLNGAIGWGMLLAVLFSLTDIQAILETKTGLPFIQLFYNISGLAGANTMTIIVTILGWCASIGYLATASRMVWSFARDQGLPFHSIVSRVHSRTKVPVYAVLVVAVVPCLLTLIYIGSSIAYNDVVSLVVSGLYFSYLVPCSLLLWRRVTGKIRARGEVLQNDVSATETDADMQSGEKEAISEVVIEWGPWRVPGVFGTINNAFACAYCIFVLFWDFWPPQTPVSAKTMNYSVLVFGSVVIFSTVYYFVYAKSQYKGPLIDNEVKGIADRYVVVREKTEADQ